MRPSGRPKGEYRRAQPEGTPATPTWLARAGDWLWRDTLARRLFVLMWVALVLSQGAAWLVTSQGGFGPAPPSVMAPGFGPWPGTEPMPGFGPPPAFDGPMPMPMPPAFPALPLELPWTATLVDYGVRLLLIALAAWWGARWLAHPMQRLVTASQALSPALQRGESPRPLDEHDGTVEVNAAAAVFNGMARTLQQQFEARALMVAALSHDLRTPITRLRMRLETADVAPALLDRSAADLREMTELIDSVLSVFRPMATGPDGRAPRTDTAALVQALCDDLAEAGAAVRCAEPPAAACVVRGDALLLKRVVGNLVHNALRYAGAAEVAVQRQGDEVQLLIEDRGPGIPAAQREAVMQPFTRLESSRNRDTGGVGLGLYIAREGAARLGGRLLLSEREGGGLRAQVLLPAG